jgi:phosphatidylglycerol:prolipoprotein diacylglycerol transferase
VASRESRRRRLPDFIYDLGIVMLLTGFVGGRIFYYVENYRDEYAGQSFLELFKIWKGGLVFYGGAISGLLGGWFYCWKKKLPVADSLDVAALGAPIGMAFGRIGCFFNGCCFGTVCDPAFPLGVVFPHNTELQHYEWRAGWIDSPLSKPLPVHPAQLYQAAHDFLLFGLLFWYLRRPDAPRGTGIPLLFLLYGVGRFCLEGLRGDNARTFTGLTISQNLSLAMIVGFGLHLMVLLARARKKLTFS